MLEVANNEKISEDFIWFNDDIYVLKKVEEIKYFKT
jgi:hypothetical protein